MRCALVCVALLAGIGPALAQRSSTTNLTCAQARTVVTRQGAAVLGTGGPTFDRFVRDRSFCEATEIGRRAFVPTRDNPGCFVGYTCYEPGPGDRFGDF
ncbi:hypothetical protein [Methylorubrum extorquens]|jgi:predicted DNA-binding transcriptional regulator AlpA|uniref:hypothetical protein n=1 Tax=Methylorubrum extorquens TaxID=408 RepID=UPI0022371EB4|nr:hypothetical protein [Methylorubrum extorquens]UYW25958.1 hypothetical protein OKC48_22220 [Methylorubrum extorquens]UYW34235.1 hypothetical protein OKB92_09200 [Methylorubrum extorquens]